MTIKWTLSDGAGSHTFAVNPTPGTGSGDMTLERPVTNEYVDDNGPMVTLGQLNHRTSKFQVETLTRSERDAMWEWFDKKTILTLTDDWSRTFTILLTKCNEKRSRKASNPYYRQITVDFIVVTVVEA